MSIATSAALLFFATMMMTTPLLVKAQDDDDGTGATATAPQCAPWAQVTALTFLGGQTTQSRRRTSNIPTMNCVGNCPSDARLDAAQCLQTGISDMGTPTWKCVPQFGPSHDHRYALGSVRVECEGCRKRGDSSIVRGSCALYYSVVDSTLPSTRRRGGGVHHAHQVDLLGMMLMILFVCFVVVIAKRMFCDTPAKVVDGYPISNAAGQPAYHPGYHPGYGYGGGSGFGTGMLTGLVVGDMLSRPHGGSYYNDYDDGSSGGGGGWGGGWGGGDGAGYGGSDSI